MKPATRIGQRYQLGDRVRKKTIGGTKPPRIGTVLSAQIQEDTRGHKKYYYEVQWDDLRTPALHAQHVLLPE